MTKLTFLGTGGGRFVTLMQERSTGGIYLEDSVKVHIDPGPGALHALKRNRLDPIRTDIIMVSHCHPDHYANAEILIEGMSIGKRGRRGVLIGPRSVIRGWGRIGPAVSRYHQNKLAQVNVVQPGSEFHLGELKAKATPSLHSDPDSVGFRISTKHGDISYVSDTELRDEVIDAHLGARVLILPNTRPLRSRIPNHLSTEDSAVFAGKVRPELCILTHLGRKVLKEDPRRQADYVTERSGVDTIAARDDMALIIGSSLELLRFPKRPVPQRGTPPLEPPSTPTPQTGDVAPN